MLNFGLAPKGTTPHRNNGRWKENAGGEKQLYCEPHILNSNTGWSNVQNMWNSTPPTPLCYCYNCTVLAAHFVLPHEKTTTTDPRLPKPPPKKRRRQTSKTLRDLPKKKDDDAIQICRKNDLYYQSWLQQCPKKRKHKFHLLNFATSFATELDHFYSGL